MSRPDHQIPGLRLRNPAKILVASKKIRRTLILIGKPSLLVDGVYEVRAIGAALGFVSPFERRAQDG
jgi:hypothetical protein